MESRAHRFRVGARQALNDEALQRTLGRCGTGFVDRRAAAVAEIPDFEALRRRGEAIREHALDYLPTYLERFEAQVTAQGGKVHWADDADSANRIISAICRRTRSGRILKAKTMVGEEVGLNEALARDGFEIVETDLGEYIIQLAQEPPSHIIAPAIHKSREQICTLFDRAHHGDGSSGLREVPELVAEARRVLREKFLSADVGITGANFLIAETGSVVVVTNEGNADLAMTQPRVHVVIAGIEKVVPTLEDAGTLLRLLARSATGQSMTAYTTLVTGARREGDPDGPDEFHVVLVDNGRSRMLDGPYRAMLRCIRCGACLNHCPVYGAVGGHAYGWVYPGPMGAVLTPQFLGLESAYDLPNACTLNGRCQAVCPVGIPLPRLLRSLREEQYRRKIAPRRHTLPLKIWAWLARRPALYSRTSRFAAALMSRMGPRLARYLPGFGAWVQGRDLPLPQGETFMTLWHRKGKRR